MGYTKHQCFLCHKESRGNNQHKFKKIGTHVKSCLARFIMFLYLIALKCSSRYRSSYDSWKTYLSNGLKWQWIHKIPASTIFRQIWCQNNCWNIHRNRNLEANEWRKIWCKAKLIRKRSMVSILLSGQNFFRQQILFISQHCLRLSTQLQKPLCKNITESSFSPFPPQISFLLSLGTISSKKIKQVEDRYQAKKLFSNCSGRLLSTVGFFSEKVMLSILWEFSKKPKVFLTANCNSWLIFWGGGVKLNKLSKVL